MNDQIPTGATPLKLACVKCGQIIHTYTEANMKNDIEAEIVERMANSFVCGGCDGTKTLKQFGFAPWERARA